MKANVAGQHPREVVMGQMKGIVNDMEELRASFKAFVGKGLPEREKEDMDALVDAFFQEEVFPKPLESIERDFTSINSLILHFKRFLGGSYR
jgi:hypothetical protein